MAAFSHRPWLPHVQFDRFEDLLHSASATGVGLAFAGGVILEEIVRVHVHSNLPGSIHDGS
jgi:hypothetical protein